MNLVSCASRLRVFVVLVAVAIVCAADAPVVGPGASKEDVIKAYGWPTGQGRLGTKEVLNYPQGTVTLADGKVERVDFSPNVTWAPPKPRPAPPTATTGKRATVGPEFWGTSFDAAAREAQGRHARILAVFVGSDWSPPSIRFLDEIVPSPEFFNAFTADFVFLKLDFPTRAPQTAELKKQNEDLRARCGVTTYPSLVVMSARGDPLGVVDLTKERAGTTYRDRVTEAVAELRDLLRMQKPASEDTKAEPKPAVRAPAAAVEPAPQPRSASQPATSTVAGAAITSARWVLLVGLGGGVVLVVGLLWWVWRSRPAIAVKTSAQPNFGTPKVRLSDIPSPPELTAWPAERLRTLVAAQFEATGYTAHLCEPGGDIDVELTRPGHTKPSVIVSCHPGSGAVGAKKVREFFGTLVSNGVDAGWIVSPAGFDAEATALAHERGIEAIDGAGLTARLHALDPLVLSDVLRRVSA